MYNNSNNNKNNNNFIKTQYNTLPTTPTNVLTP